MRNLTTIVRPPNRSIAEQMYEMVWAAIEARVYSGLTVDIRKTIHAIVDDSSCGMVRETVFYATLHNLP